MGDENEDGMGDENEDQNIGGREEGNSWEEEEGRQDSFDFEIDGLLDIDVYSFYRCVYLNLE